jgi:hypothetical protein
MQLRAPYETTKVLLTCSLGSLVKFYRPSTAEVPDTGTRGHAESEHVDTHDKLDYFNYEHRLVGEPVIPYLETNQFRSCLLAFLPSKKLSRLRTVPRWK